MPVVDVFVAPSIFVVIVIVVIVVIVVVVAIRCRCRVSPALSGENWLRPPVEGSLVRAARKSRKRWEFVNACRVAVVAPSLITERGAITGRVRTSTECERVDRRIASIDRRLDRLPIAVSRKSSAESRLYSRAKFRRDCAVP